MNAPRQWELITHLTGVRAALKSLARVFEEVAVSEDASQLRVCSQLEWAAGHLGAAVTELGGGQPRAESAGTSARADADEASMSCLHGHSRAIAVPEFLGFVSGLRKSGLLRIEAPDESFLIELYRGELVHAESDVPLAGGLLGDIFLEQGAIDRDHLEEIARYQEVERRRLGQLLLERGQISRQQLSIALAVQVQRLFHRMWSAEDVRYRFDEGAQLEVGADVRLDVTALLLESARTSDENARLTR